LSGSKAKVIFGLPSPQHHHFHHHSRQLRLRPPSHRSENPAVPAVPRALPVTSSVSTVSNAQWQSIRMPSGEFVRVSYQGELPSSAALPARGRFIGEEYSTGNTSWIWMTPAGANFPSWVDP
jgi:hypothetical protein